MNAHIAPQANVLSIQQLSKQYGSRFAVNQATWSATRGQIICLLGHSGCGKTTMLRLIAGLETPSSGSIQLEHNILWNAQQQIPAEDRNIGLVFQDYALFPHLSVLENVMFGLKKLPKQQRQSIAEQALKHVSMHHHLHSYPYTLSGGEQQRVALARALAPKPYVLLMDEPFSNLDHRLRDQIRQSTIDVLKKTATTTIIVTHDPEEALQIADQIILMHQGKIIQIGTPKQLYLQPKTLFAARYFSALNEIPTQRLGHQLTTLFGTVPVSQHLSDTQQPIQCCFRPHQFDVFSEPTKEGLVAKVISSSFMGHTQLLRLQLDTIDTPLLAQVDHQQNFAEQEQVYVSVDLSTCFFYTSDEHINTDNVLTEQTLQV
ncbi:ABC transporter ATP-binding protein [Acinetobacter sp. NIPH 2699]|uniref:ABC transporter ATP-binding protein n=1 Tax=Acinetobacter sp. NIPH 2699 TaxID=2923433 RepID=UPI001F4B809D|nr:ABC transporter ATP-binding protein [Acinetobacter sp. NIPH 2699]MCH7335969.1 ABC transporter ATP-binding protein [Acinetobacter sp. NIPH 2699]